MSVASSTSESLFSSATVPSPQSPSPTPGRQRTKKILPHSKQHFLSSPFHVLTMTNASLLPNGAMTNGLMANGTTVHQRREVDGSSHSQPPSSLRDVCADLHTRVSAFLSSTPPDETTRRTQVQTKIALGVIEKALQDYEYARSLDDFSKWCHLHG